MVKEEKAAWETAAGKLAKVERAMVTEKVGLASPAVMRATVQGATMAEMVAVMVAATAATMAAAMVAAMVAATVVGSEMVQRVGRVEGTEAG